jgi:hypothetical protein
MASRQTDIIGILKSIWRQDDTGKWIIHDAKGIDLKPRDGFTKDYFKVTDEMVLLTQQPGKVFTNLFASFGMTEFLLRQSIVPIVAWNDGDEEMRCIGTGFFISATGYLLTAAHVLRDPIDENYASATQIDTRQHRLSEKLRFGVLLPTIPAMKTAPFISLPQEVRDARWFMCPFEWMQHWGKDVESPLLHEKAKFQIDLDIGVCKVRQHPLIGPYQPLNIGLHKLAVGDRAVAIGYAEMKNMRLSNDDYQPELIVSVGSVTAIFPDNIKEKGNPTPGPNFEFSARIPGKMSGGPILVGGGILTKGVVSRSWQNENHATGCLIAPMMSLPLVDGKSLFDLQRTGNEGIAEIVARGL